MALSRILEYAAIGQSMNQEISAVLPDINGQEISDLCKLASDTRGQRSDKIVTFSPKIFIPLTRLCRDICGYCTFRQDPQNLSDLYMSPDAIIQVAEQGEKLGCTEALFTLGERPELKYPEARKWLDSLFFHATFFLFAGFSLHSSQVCWHGMCLGQSRLSERRKSSLLERRPDDFFIL